MKDKFKKLVSSEKSGWLEKARLRRKYRTVRNVIFYLRLKQLTWKRKFLLFLHDIIDSFLLLIKQKTCKHTKWYFEMWGEMPTRRCGRCGLVDIQTRGKYGGWVFKKIKN